MAEPDNTSVVKGIYEAFGRGDIESLLGKLADNVEWVVPGHEDGIPYAGTYHGLAGVGDFFSALGESITYDQFEALRFIAQADEVAVFGHYHGTIQANAREVETKWAMEWTLKDGKVTAIRVYEDTATIAAGFAFPALC
jgi:uncharacterized protein